jgi:hypothetical protein
VLASITGKTIGTRSRQPLELGAPSHHGQTLLAAPHEQTESMPGRGGTFGRPTPFQAVTRPKVSTTLVLDHFIGYL